VVVVMSVNCCFDELMLFISYTYIFTVIITITIIHLPASLLGGYSFCLVS